MDNEVTGGELFIGRWVYHKPSLTPNKNGFIVIISKRSFGPLEVFEWGIDCKGKPYELYKWLENDIYAEENYCNNITFEELEQKIDDAINSAADNGLLDWVRIYEQAKEMCAAGTMS